jgi:hypothetical protein
VVSAKTPPLYAMRPLFSTFSERGIRYRDLDIAF